MISNCQLFFHRKTKRLQAVKWDLEFPDRNSVVNIIFLSLLL